MSGTSVVIEPSFALGELSDAISGRIDMDWYGKGLAECYNFTILSSGGATLRPGTEYIGEMPDMTTKGRLVPFMFDGTVGNCYCLLFLPGKVYVLQDGGFVSEDGSTPYYFEFEFEEDELDEFRYVQSLDTIYVTHPNYPPRKILRYGHTDWQVETPTFMPTLSAPQNVTVSTNDSGGTTEYYYCVTATNSDYTDESEISDKVSVTSRVLGYDNDSVTITVEWDAVDGADEYKVYKAVGGTYGLVGYATPDDTTDDGRIYWLDQNYDPDTGTSYPTYENPFDEEDDYPSCVGFIQQRLVFAGTNNDPQKMWFSRSGNFENFGRTDPTQDDDAIYLAIYSRQAAWVRALLSMRCLVALTGGTEYAVTGGTTDAVITPSTARATQQSAYGMADLEPEVIGNSIIMLERGGHTVRDMGYDYSVDGYQGNDLSIRSQHLLAEHTIISWAYQSSPDNILWCVRDDGILLSLTYIKEHQVYAWARHETQGEVETITCVKGDTRDEVYMIVKREINGSTVKYIERLAEPFREVDAEDATNAWYVDCGLRLESDTEVTTISGLDHLEGCEVSVLADGMPVHSSSRMYGHKPQVEAGKLTVEDGAITLPYPAKTVLIGLPFEGRLKTLRVNASDTLGPSQGRRQRIIGVSLRMDNTIAGEVGWEKWGVDGTVLEEMWVPLKYRTVQQANFASAPFVGDKIITPPSGWDDRGQFTLRQTEPLPITLLCAILRVSLGEK